MFETKSRSQINKSIKAIKDGFLCSLLALLKFLDKLQWLLSSISLELKKLLHILHSNGPLALQHHLQ